MPNTKISNLTSAGTLTGSEVAPIVQSGNTVKSTAQDIANLAIPSQAGQNGKYLTTNGSVTSWGTVSGGVSFKTYTANFSLAGGPITINQVYNDFTGGTLTIGLTMNSIYVNASGFATQPFTANKTYAMISNIRTTTPAVGILGSVSLSTGFIQFFYYDTAGANFGTTAATTNNMSVIVQTWA